MISSNDFRTGLTIEVEGDIWQVIEFQHVKPGKGAAFVRSKLKNLRNGSVQEKTFRAGEKVEQARIETKEMQFLYATGDDFIFMDNESFEQLTLNRKQIEREAKFLIENMTVHMMVYQDELLGLELPNTVILEVVETDPGIRGDTATGGSKPATLQSGLVVQVPLFINVGDKLVIDTRTEQYVSRG